MVLLLVAIHRYQFLQSYPARPGVRAQRLEAKSSRRRAVLTVLPSVSRIQAAARPSLPKMPALLLENGPSLHLAQSMRWVSSVSLLQLTVAFVVIETKRHSCTSCSEPFSELYTEHSISFSFLINNSGSDLRSSRILFWGL